MERNKAIILLFILALISTYMLLIPAQAEENTSTPANNTTIPANISQATNQTVQWHFTAEGAIETTILIGIILSPVSFILAVVALWVAWKNRRKTYNVR